MYRRPRSLRERYKLADKIRRHFPRFFPTGPSDIVIKEFRAQVAAGRIKYGPANDVTRRRYREGYYPQLLNGKWIKFGEPRPKTGRPINMANWETRNCQVCGTKFWQTGNGNLINCAPACSALALLHGKVIAFSPDMLSPITPELRYWYMTHPETYTTLRGRPPDFDPSIFLRSEFEIMARQDLREYIGEKIVLNDQQVEALRERFYEILDRQTKSIESIVKGKTKLDAQQVRVLLALMDKVIPSASAKPPSAPRMTDITPDNVAQMSRAELEKMIEHEQKIIPGSRTKRPVAEQIEEIKDDDQ
jgi:hypothetical protein